NPKLFGEAVESAIGKDGVAVLREPTKKLEEYRTKHGISAPSRLLGGLDLDAFLKANAGPVKGELVVDILADTANRNGAFAQTGEQIAMYQRMGFFVRYSEFSSPEEFFALESKKIEGADGKEFKVHLKVVASHASTFGFGAGYAGNKAGTKSEVT